MRNLGFKMAPSIWTIFFGIMSIGFYVQAIEMPACSQGKYLWRRSDPRHFYLCTSPTEAVPMRCKEGFYMCLTEDKEFEACDCRENADNSTTAEDTATEDRYEEVESFSKTECQFTIPIINRHRHLGQPFQTNNLEACKQECLTRNTTGRSLPSPAVNQQCVGVDWDSTRADVQCFLLPRSSHTYGMAVREGVNHYILECTTPVDEGAVTSTGNAGGSNNNNNGNNNNNNANNNNNQNGNGNENNIDSKQSTTSSIIPDTGSPYTFQKFEDSSHPNGLNITSELDSIDYESCKRWCLYRCYCKAVDWDSFHNSCFYHSSVDPESLRTDAAASGVTHVRKIGCSAPLNCWQHGPRNIQEANGNAVVDPSHEQVVCHGVCTVIQDISTTPIKISRGCDPDPPEDLPINCVGLTESVFRCTCDTHRCNGLNIQLLANQKAHLPLDGDFTDHALTFKRDVTPVDGFKLPSFSCTNAFSNCSAYFTGSNGIAIRELAQIVYGETLGANQVSPALTITAAVYPIDFDGSGIEGGIVGNSQVAEHLPSFMMGVDGNKWSAGVLAQNKQQLTDNAEREEQLVDYDPYISGQLQQWRMLTMVYDGVENDATSQQASLHFYIDMDLQQGNSRRDNGLIQFRSEPVTIGVVGGKPFTGYIDEIRIFGTTMETEEIQALLNMYRTENIVV